MESNHDLKMLENGPYPAFLKQRIASNKGHISNLNSALCILEHASSKLSHLMLAHLSKTNNTPNLALSVHKNLIKERYDLKPKISVSNRDIPSPLFKI
jgi:phosphoribosyl 1,2-cyclic phosphodiesterase